MGDKDAGKDVRFRLGWRVKFKKLSGVEVEERVPVRMTLAAEGHDSEGGVKIYMILNTVALLQPSRLSQLKIICIVILPSLISASTYYERLNIHTFLIDITVS